jgi:hypothetical protein
MATLRCTQKYRKAFKLPERLPEPPPSGTVLGEWYANTLSIGRNRLIHYMSGQTLLSVIVPLKDRKLAEDRFRIELRRLLLALGISGEVVDRELELMTDLCPARASNRSIQASMRDQALVAKNAVLGRRASSTWEIMVDLTQMPCGALGYSNSGRETLRLFGAKMQPNSP